MICKIISVLTGEKNPFVRLAVVNVPPHPNSTSQTKTDSVSIVRSLFDLGTAISGVTFKSGTDECTPVVRTACADSVWMKLTGEKGNENFLSSSNENNEIALQTFFTPSPGVPDDLLVTHTDEINKENIDAKVNENENENEKEKENNRKNESDIENAPHNKESVLTRWNMLGIKVPSSDDYYLARVGWFPDGSVMAQVIYVHAYLHTCVLTYIHTYMRTYIHTYIRTCIHTFIHTYIHSYIHTYIHTYVHAYIHINRYVNTYT